ncbi:hypothetical protein ACEWF6_01745 [Bifidobacterium catenulatum subsp. kashiwanohense]
MVAYNRAPRHINSQLKLDSLRWECSVVVDESVEFVFDGVAQVLLHGRAVFGGGDFEAVLQPDGQAQGRA